MTQRRPGAARSRWRPSAADLLDSLVALLSTAAGLWLAVTVVAGPGWLRVSGVLMTAFVVAVGDALLRPALRLLALVVGAVGALVAGTVVQVAVLWVALALLPGLHLRAVGEVLQVLVLTALVMAAGRWLLGVNDSEYVVADVLRRSRSHARREGVRPPTGQGDGRPAGLLVVQLDGVGAAVLQHALGAGLVPTMHRWLRRGSHVWEPWWARVPSSTPASQAGLLHGTSDAVPSFRWWDRRLGRLVVTNRPGDATLVEERLSDGHGLLSGGGSAVSTMFSGDADRAFLVMSRRRRSHGPARGPSYVRFTAHPFLLARAVVLSLLEMVKELYQAHRQRRRDVRPRVSRWGWYVVLRGVTNVLLRDLTTSLVADTMMRGDPVVFVDYVDYDEIAHHAGPTRPESMRALEGLDRVLSVLERVAEVAPRDYRIVVLSDHGQAQGPTFEDVEGRSLLEVVHGLQDHGQEPPPVTRGSRRAGAPDVLQAGDDEDWGPISALLSEALRRPHVAAPARDGRDARPVRLRLTGLLDERLPRRSGRVAPDPAAVPSAPDGSPVPRVVVAASGNLGTIWFPRLPGRPALEDLQELWPAVVPGLAARSTVGVVVVDSRARGLLAVGARGVRALERDDEVEGEDPLACYGPQAAADLVRAARLPDAADLLLLSAVSPTGTIHAFEHQVGSHGGIGGQQNHAVLLHPAELPVVPEEPGAPLTGVPVTDGDLDAPGGRPGSVHESVVPRLVGAEAVHRQLVAWACALGVRDEPGPRGTAPTTVSRGAVGAAGSQDDGTPDGAGEDEEAVR